MKNLFKFFILAVLAVCGVACGPLGGDDNGGNGGNGGNPTPNQTSFTINVSEITSSSATVSVTPSDNSTYYFDVIEKEYLDQYIIKKDFATEMVAELKSYLEEYGYTLDMVLSVGRDVYSYDGELDANTVYYAYAFGISNDGAITTDVTVKEFTTLSSGSDSGSTSNNTFEIAVSGVTSNSATVSVYPSNNDTYYFDVYDKATVDQYGDINTFAAEYIASLKEYLTENGYTFADVLSSGADSYSFEGVLEANTVYYAFAFGASSNGAITTDVTSKTFTTEASGSTGGGTTPSTGDLALNNFTYGYYSNYGDYYGTGATNWYIDLYTYDTYDVLILEVQTPTSATSFEGTYNFNSSLAANTAVPYFIDDDGYICGSYWCLLDSDYNIADYRGCASGSLKISKSGSDFRSKTKPVLCNNRQGCRKHMRFVIIPAYVYYTLIGILGSHQAFNVGTITLMN
jgi:hypothetical protein